MGVRDLTKKEYETPILRVHGKVEDLTKGGSTGTASDAVFPAGTPSADVTFS
ncbi:lasso RiPP family leader peptide-containing protein [Roseobacter denitrificans]|nr:lasso RiPP family leader peptide-containing protein [Roseobacter denitrificans]